MATNGADAPQDYEIENCGKVDYVAVRCPNGHRMRGLKTGDKKMRQTITCGECRTQWMVLAPPTNGMEGCV